MFDNTSVHPTCNVSNRSYSYGTSSMDHREQGTFFVSFEWGSKISERLMGDRPRVWCDGEGWVSVEIVQMVTMLERVVAEVKVVK